MEQQSIPVHVYVEMTPNPATMKFVANKLLIDEGVAEYAAMSEAKGSSPLAEKLFNFPFVSSVFIMGNFVTVTKNETIDWDYVTMELREFITDYIKTGEKPVTKVPEPKEETATVENNEPVEPSEFDDQIKDILEEYVRPAVERDGGLIEFKSYVEGVVTVILRGACSGCPSSTQTLKGGIQALLQKMIPEVTDVVAEER